MTFLMPTALEERADVSLSFLLRCALILGAVGLGGAILMAGSAGSLHRYLDIASHLMWHGAGALAGGLLALVFFRRAVTVLAVTGLLTLLVPGLMAWGHVRGIGPPAGQEQLKVLSFNTLHRNRDLDAIVDLVRREDPDVAIFLEFGRSKQAVLDRLAQQYPYQAGCHDDVYCAVAIVSKRPWTEAGGVRRWGRDGPPTAWARFDTSAGPLTIFGVHMMRPIDSPRRHLWEMDLLAGQVRHVEQTGGQAIVMGDMNATRMAHSLQHFEARSGARHMGSVMPSWPMGRYGLPPQLAIDHAYATTGIDISAAWLGPAAGSDHLPLIAIYDVPGW